ncbi:DUF4031 domain-containing protein [Actinomadura sp. WMMB 499]|uniref:DUF4031 domain-containing protein n=1 Tax=Actinomadura sp. WMMB 499 TaxID=1219491 RepID=UPI00124768D4|nr:DUF4031 domain-containing protein [Actinomadura sp. WMMB 499]QFG25044.1 DUF4031 domain-containing protein [Actinomadura sp. WMMB 499]
MILIDPPLWPARGRVWSHMVSDVSYAELHAFAEELGMPPRAFDRDHYDVPSELYQAAVAQGAVPVGCQELLLRLTRAGLRQRKVVRGALRARSATGSTVAKARTSVAESGSQ